MNRNLKKIIKNENVIILSNMTNLCFHFFYIRHKREKWDFRERLGSEWRRSKLFNQSFLFGFLENRHRRRLRLKTTLSPPLSCLINNSDAHFLIFFFSQLTY